MVLAHSLGLSLPLIQFAPKCSRKAFSPVPISSSRPGESTPSSHCWNCHGLTGSDIKLLSLGSKLSLLHSDLWSRDWESVHLFSALPPGSIIGFVNRGSQSQTARQESLPCGLLVGHYRLPLPLQQLLNPVLTLVEPVAWHLFQRHKCSQAMATPTLRDLRVCGTLLCSWDPHPCFEILIFPFLLVPPVLGVVSLPAFAISVYHCVSFSVSFCLLRYLVNLF